MSKLMAVMFALMLGLALSCGGSDDGGGGGGGAAAYTPDNAPVSSGTSTLTSSQQTAVEQEVTVFVTTLSGAFGGMTSRAAEKVTECIPGEVVEGCATSQVCYEVSGSQTDAHVKVWTDDSMNCNGVNLYFFEYDFDMSVSGQQVLVENAAGAIDIEYLEEFPNPVRIFVKWDNDGKVEGWIAENGELTCTIGGTTTNPTFAWE